MALSICIEACFGCVACLLTAVAPWAARSRGTDASAVQEASKASCAWPLKGWKIASRRRLCGGEISLRYAVLAVLLAVAVLFLLPCYVFAQHHMASEMLVTEGLDNNLCAYNALISGCTSSRGYDRALGYYKDMVSLVRELGC